MKRIFMWLEGKISRREAVTDQPSNPESAKPDEIDLGMDLPKGLPKPTKSVLMPDIYSDEHVATISNLKILDQPSLEDGESAGVNPYDTGVFQKK